MRHSARSVLGTPIVMRMQQKRVEELRAVLSLQNEHRSHTRLEGFRRCRRRRVWRRRLLLLGVERYRVDRRLPPAPHEKPPKADERDRACERAAKQDGSRDGTAVVA